MENSKWFRVHFEKRQNELISGESKEDIKSFLKKRVKSKRSGLDEQNWEIEETDYTTSSITKDDSVLHLRRTPWRAIDRMKDPSIQYESRTNIAGANSLYFGRYPELTNKDEQKEVNT